MLAAVPRRLFSPGDLKAPLDEKTGIVSEEFLPARAERGDVSEADDADADEDWRERRSKTSKEN